MRILVLLRGAPGCGKSTWIREHGLSEYSLSADAIRCLFASPELNPDGKLNISQRNDKIVWETLFKMLERRMQRGEFTVIDACNSKTKEMKRYKEFADQYRYRMYCIDMTGIPLEEVLRRNAGREQKKIVPEDYIRNVYARFETQQIPSGIVKVAPEDFESILMKPFDLSEYNRVVHVGDIHGCFDALQKAFGDDPASGIDPKSAYIFVGDYIDRGPENTKVLDFLMKISQMKNVCLLEGNHEAHLWAWANDRTDRSRDFGIRTRFELEAAGVNKANVRKLYRKLRQCSYYSWNGKTVLCTHGGLPRLDAYKSIDFVNTYQMIHGVGGYEDMEACADSFERQDIIDFQVFGHRNVKGIDPLVHSKSIILENGVECGGTLRIATLSEGGWTFDDYVSDKAVEMAPAVHEAQSFHTENSDIIASLVDQMRSSPLINEKKFGHISSFNFTRAAFADKKWNDLTVRARGLYIDTQNMKVAARGYEKFFAVEERNETSIHALSRNLVFPVEVYKKENGFLGLLSYDKATESLFITTKSTPDGDMAKLFASMLSEEMRKAATEFLREHDVTLLFEVVHPTVDPHIIKYNEPSLFLLDSVDNTLNFAAAPYSDLIEIAALLKVRVKECVAVLNTWDEFLELYKSTQRTLKSNADPFEGYVARDMNGFMVKMKTDFYTTWKMLRGVADKVYNYGYIKNTSALTTPMMNYFYAFVKQYYCENREHQSVIALREKFEISGNKIA